MKKRGGRIFFGGLPVATVCTMITLATVSVIVTSLCTVVVTTGVDNKTRTLVFFEIFLVLTFK